MWCSSRLNTRSQALYIVQNNICNISNVLNFIIFADDTNIFCTGDKIEEVAATVSTELNNYITV